MIACLFLQTFPGRHMKGRVDPCREPGPARTQRNRGSVGSKITRNGVGPMQTHNAVSSSTGIDGAKLARFCRLTQSRQ